MAKKKKIWALQGTQRALWLSMLSKHKAELRPLQAYQEEQRRLLLETVGKELGIPPGPNVTFNSNALSFESPEVEKKPKPKPKAKLELAKKLELARKKTG